MWNIDTDKPMAYLSSMEALKNAAKIIRWAGIARACDRKPPSIQKWKVRGLPKTEATGETQYSKAIYNACAIKDPARTAEMEITVEALLQCVNGVHQFHSQNPSC